MLLGLSSNVELEDIACKGVEYLHVGDEVQSDLACKRASIHGVKQVGNGMDTEDRPLRSAQHALTRGKTNFATVRQLLSAACRLNTFELKDEHSYPAARLRPILPEHRIER